MVIPLLLLAIILALVAFANDSPDEPHDEPSSHANHETISLPGLNETPEPPDSGGFPPPPDNGDSEAPHEDTALSDEALSDDALPNDTLPNDTATNDYLNEDSNEYNETDNSDTYTFTPGRTTLNLTTGRLSLIFSPQVQTSLDRDTSNLLDIFLRLPNNTQDNALVIETPILSREQRDQFMTVLGSALAERNIDSQRITHIENPEIPSNEHFEAVLYFMTTQGK
jgi:hypothetical protein